jgi:membrane protease YdiL (CAAX protease family)
MKSPYAKIATTILVPLCLWTLLLLSIPYSSSFSLFLKVALWGIPAYFLPKLMDSANPNDFLLLKRIPQGKWIYLSAVFLIAYSLFINGGKVEINSVSGFYFVTAIVISPIVEEIAFRGFILQKLNQIMPFRLSNIVTAIGFTLYHLPLWLARGQSVSILACLWVVFFPCGWATFCIDRNLCGRASLSMHCRICFLGFCNPAVLVNVGRR